MGLKDLLGNFIHKKIHGSTILCIKKQKFIFFESKLGLVQMSSLSGFVFLECVSTITIVTICRAVNYEGPGAGQSKYRNIPSSKPYTCQASKHPCQMTFKGTFCSFFSRENLNQELCNDLIIREFCVYERKSLLHFNLNLATKT